MASTAKTCYVFKMDQSYKSRAEARRARISVGVVANSFDELEQAGLEYWQNATPGERLSAIWQLIVDEWVIGGKRGPPPRFDGSTCGVLSFER
jgi:hypothetical protein